MPYNQHWLTVIETPLFSRLWPDYWTEEERGAFCAWLASHPDVGDVIPGSGGCRKVRWSRPGMGKRGGVRVIYTLQTAGGPLWFLLIYAKGAKDNVPAHILREIREEMDDA
ncbi:MAG: transcriptional regulator [Acidiferrobacteraceae bacterium]